MTAGATIREDFLFRILEKQGDSPGATIRTIGKLDDHFELDDNYTDLPFSHLGKLGDRNSVTKEWLPQRGLGKLGDILPAKTCNAG